MMPRSPIHPGEHLQEELQELSITSSQLAERLAVKSDLLDEVLCGRRDLSADLALRLGHYFGTSPEFWMGLQNLYDLRIAERDHGDAIRALPQLEHPIAA